MATTENSIDGRRERCDECGLETLHEVSIQMRTEKREGSTAKFSREPYRVTECQRCGGRTNQRMNNC